MDLDYEIFYFRKKSNFHTFLSFLNVRLNRTLFSQSLTMLQYNNSKSANNNLFNAI
jgi:hypothetical protein